jgi:A/G-specific adenine glycosylase
MPPIPDPEAVSGALEAWFAGAARDLPWRRARSGYGALVSEVMLQQTQVSRVVGPFDAFMARFPSPAALAAAPEPEVLAAWRGLGYYRRARMLHAAAKSVCERFGGTVPATSAELRTLPGVGRYTAAAIASIVFGERTPIVDGNVVRVLSRLADAPATMGEAATERWAWEQAARLAGAARAPGATNEALMELGATVCTPAQPACGGCPLAGPCRARANGTAALRPAPRRQGARRTLRWSVAIDWEGRGVVLERRPSTGLWAGLMQPPTAEGTASDDPDVLARGLGEGAERIGAFTHVISHRDVEFTVYRVRAGSAAARGERHEASRLQALPMSNAALRALEIAGIPGGAGPVRTPSAPRAARRPGRAGRSASTGS